jgi:hypothetical protein
MKKVRLTVLFFIISCSTLLAQLDTLSWSYVVNQPWVKPAKLDSFAGVHPRMLLNSSRIETLKTKIAGTHKFIWNVIKGKADSYLNSSPRNSPGDESDTRSDGDAVPWLALAYVLTGENQYLNKAVDWMTTVCNYSTWDGNHSLAAGHCLMGISLGYDWLYHSMNWLQRRTIRDRLSHFAPAMAYSPQHKERYLANHCQVEYAGLAAAGFALYDEVPEAEDWLRQAYYIFNEAYQVCGDDGSSTEGHQYYGLMTEFQMHFNKMAKELLGRDFYSETEWLKNIGYFILYSTLPNFSSDKCVMRYGDTKSMNFHGHGPGYQLFNVAVEYRNPYFQWMALEMFDRGIGTTHRMGWANLLWYDETLTATSLDSLPCFRHFEDTGWITSRSSWGKNAVMIGFKCGPFHGHAVQDLYNNMAGFHQIVNGHGHPDVNHFNIYAYGNAFITDDAYPKPKWTRYHNTILVNGYGQLGEGSSYFNRSQVFHAKATSRIIKAKSNSDFDYIIGDAENIYKPEAGLKKFLRHCVFLKPDFIIILDELEAEAPSKFEWLLNASATITSVTDNQFRIKIGSYVMDNHFLLPSKISHNIEYKLLKISPAEDVAEAIILAVMHPRKKSDLPGRVDLVSCEDLIIHLEIIDGEERKSVIIDLDDRDIDLTSAINESPSAVPYVQDKDIIDGGSFSINLNEYVTDPDDPDSVLTWLASGNNILSVSIEPVINRATFTAPFNTIGNDTILLTVSDGGVRDTTMMMVNVLNIDETINEIVSSDTGKVIFQFADSSKIMLDFLSGGVTGSTITVSSYIGHLPPSMDSTALLMKTPVYFSMQSDSSMSDFSAQLTVKYTDLQLSEAEITDEEGMLSIAVFNESSKTWEIINTIGDVDRNTVTAVIDRFSLYWALVIDSSKTEIESYNNNIISRGDYHLFQNYPNPFNPTTTIKYRIPAPGRVSLDIINIAGQKVLTLIDEVHSAGFYEISWNGKNNVGQYAADGIYLYRLKSGDCIKSGKMLLLK